jgi:putative tryptophan/tyrosine transport system substrate-binding protein
MTSVDRAGPEWLAGGQNDAIDQSRRLSGPPLLLFLVRRALESVRLHNPTRRVLAGRKMRRRQFIAALGGAALGGTAAYWPGAARAQLPVLPVIGFLSSAWPDLNSIRLRAFREGLSGAGYFEGQNVVIEYRWAEGLNERLPALAADLVQHGVTVIAAAGGTPSAVAAKAATATIPIVFGVAVDPVATGLIASLNQPGGNLTGVTDLNVELGPKRLELLRQLLPTATTVALLVNPSGPSLAGPYTQTLKAASNALRLQLLVLQARTEEEFDRVFAAMVQSRVDALVIASDTFFNTKSETLAALSRNHALPTIAQYRPFVAAGGLMCYGSDEIEYYRLLGVYTGKILNGEKPAGLPVVQSTKVELIINLNTAKALGITVPLSLLGRADELIE